MAKISIKSYNRPYSRSRSRGRGWYEKSVYVRDAGKRVAPRHREVALRGHHSRPRPAPISSHYSRKLMNRDSIQRTIPKAPKKSYDTGHTIHNVDMVELKQNDISVYIDGEGNIISYGYQHEGKTINLPNTGYEKQREMVYTEKSRRHPAKMDTHLCQSLVQEYSKPKDTVYDPMAGAGTTGIESSRLGRNVVLVDVEKQWTNEIKKNKKLLQKAGQYDGDIKVITGDARKVKLSKKADVVITSPPFENVLWGTKKTYKNEKWKETGMYTTKSDHSYGRNIEGQIGSMNGEKYYIFTKEIYEQCNKNLKTNGIMIVHTKNFIREGKEIKFDEKTKKVVEESGFKLIEKRKRKVEPSFFRMQYERKHPDAPKIHHEDLLVFKKVSNI